MAFDNKKTFSRNEQVRFTAKFFEEDEEINPIIPISSAYPSFQIRNPKSDIVLSGTAVDYSTQGNYQVSWTIPRDAMLSSDEDSWTIEWIMVASDGRQIQYKENFLVVDLSIETEEDHSIIQVVQAQKTFRLHNYFEIDPIEINLDIFDATNSSEPILSFDKSQLVFVKNERGHIGYYVDVKNGLSQGEYLAMWSYRYSELSDISREYKSVRSVKHTILRYADQLKILIDRYNKRQSAPNAYSDSDLIEFLDKGLGMVNAWYPVSNPAITWDTVDGSPYKIFVIACSAIWALKSQYLLENDLAFNFCLDNTSYVKTEFGLVMLKDLNKDLQYNETLRDTYYRLCSEENRRIVNLILDNIEDGKYSCQEIIDKVSLSKTPNQLGILFSNLNLSKFRFREVGENFWTWKINSEFREIAKKNCGIVHKDIYDKYFDYPCSYPLNTYLGTQHPNIVFNLGRKKVRELLTTTGTRLVCTNNHPSLVLTKEFEFVEKRADEIKVGDYLLIDNREEDESKYWDVNFSNILEEIKNKGYNENIELPNKMTKELARVIGYLISDGYIEKNQIKFFSKERELIEDFKNNFNKCVSGLKFTENEHSNGTIYVSVSSVKLVSFFSLIGYRKTTSYYHRIPWSIMQSPLCFVREFVIGMIEGDGCYYPGTLSFSSSSTELRQDLKLLLLRFGIISRNRQGKNGTVKNLIISGPSLKKYADKIGFFRKGNGFHSTFNGNNFKYNEGHCGKDFYNSHIESLPKFVLDYIKNVRKRNRLGKIAWVDFGKGYKERVEISIDKFHGRSSSYLSYEELSNYFSKTRKTIKVFDKEMYKKLKILLKYKFQFEKVVSNKKYGKAIVADPFLPEIRNEKGKLKFLSNYFTCNGVVTHNSGQTTTIDYDRTGNIDTFLSGLIEWVNNNLSKAKVATTRSYGIGSVAVRPISIYNNLRNRVVAINGPHSQVGSVFDLMVLLGL